MGNFPIQRASGSLPSQGPNVYWNVDTRTGEQFVAGAMGQLGQGVMGVGLVMNRLQADTELADAIMADRQAIQELAIELQGNTDSHTYDEAFNKTLGTIQGREIKNGLAAREHSLFVKRMTPSWQKGIAGAKQARIESNYTASLFQMETAAIQGKASFKGYQIFLQDGVDAGIIGKDEAVQRLYKTQHGMERRQLEELAMTDPEGALEFAEHFHAGDVVGFETIDSMDVRDIQAIATGQQAYNDMQFDEQKAAAYNTVFALAAEPNITPAIMHQQLLLTPNLGPKERDDLFKMYMRVRKDLQAGKKNPFTSTRDYGSFMKMWAKIDAEQPMTIADLWAENMSDDFKQKGPKWSVNDFARLQKMLEKRDKPDVTGYSRTHPVSKSFFQEHLALYTDTGDLMKVPEGLREQYRNERFAIEEMLKENWGNGSAMTKGYEAIVERPKKEKAKSLLGRYIDLFPTYKLGKEFLAGGAEARLYRTILGQAEREVIVEEEQ